MDIRDVIIIGSGPAANTAGIYTARANLNPLILEGSMPGGQLITTTIVENYPGFADGIDGYELMQNMRQQCLNCGCSIETDDVIGIDINISDGTNIIHKVYTKSKEYKTKAIIVATGATAKKMDIINGELYWNKGISACATCDGALLIFRKKPIGVIGGGDTACEEALHLSKFASIVYIFVRKEQLRASKIMQKKVFSNQNIKIMFNTEVLEVNGDGELLQSVKIINNIDGDQYELMINGLFYGIGHKPNTEFLDGKIDLDDNGYIRTNNTKTNVRGIFACGDVQDHNYRQAITAAGSGCMAALECERYLEGFK